MKPKEIFSLAIRLLGLLFLYHGLRALPTMVTLIFSGGGFRSILYDVLMVVWQFALAVWFIRGAPYVLREAYPDARTPGE